MNSQLKSIDKRLKGLVSKQSKADAKVEIFFSVPGAGAVTGAMLLAELPELRQLSGQIGQMKLRIVKLRIVPPT